jgi:myo-inositol-1(or 4)-monophosphatase
LRWIIDPLDGTTNFIHGIPMFCVSVALEDRDGLLAGAIYDPVHDEMFHASRGNGARLNNRSIRCSDPARFDDALLCTGFPFRYFHKVDGYLKVFRTFMEGTSGIRRAGSAAMDLAYTACGRYDGFWETGLAPWDMAAGALLVREAGGLVTDFIGGDRYLEDGEIVAGGAAVHRRMLGAVREHLVD